MRDSFDVLIVGAGIVGAACAYELASAGVSVGVLECGLAREPLAPLSEAARTRVLELLEQDLGKPVISSASAMMWHALRLAGVRQLIPGYGRLLTLS